MATSDFLISNNKEVNLVLFQNKTVKMRGEGRVQYSWESYQQNITAAFKALSQVQPSEDECSAV